MGFIFRYLAPYKAVAILAPVFMVFEVTMDLIQPTIMQHIIDNGIAEGNTAYVIKMFVFMILAAIGGLIGGVGCSIFASRAAVNFATDLREAVFTATMFFSSKNKHDIGVGTLITNVTGDVETLQRAVMMTLKVFVRGPLLFVGAVIIVFFTARELFSLLLIIVPILMVLIILFTTLSGKVFGRVQKQMDRVNTFMQENLAGVRVVKAFNRSKHQIEHFTAINDKLADRSIRAEKVVGTLSPLSMFVINIGMMAALWLGVIKVEQGALEVGVILAFINYLTIIMNGIMSASNVLIQIARAVPSAKRVKRVLNTTTTIQTPTEAVTTPIRGDITFEDVSFYYYNKHEYVLKDISFHIKAGETLGVIGMTGSGKSSLARLIPRLYDAQKGRVLIDGKPVAQYDLQTLREAIGFAPQQAILFSGTVAEQLQFGRADASSTQMNEALASSAALEFVERFDDQLDHHIDQGGRNLSGGQRQRLAMARAFIRQPSILILDDTTSAVDAVSERQIQMSIARDFAEATKVIIASKIASIQHADHILVLEDGHMVGYGTHAELLANNEVYQEIAATQQQQGGVIHE
ncbi:ABC transporter ATP-binding protein [Kurthia massiliensis]|uniref:ABC transporter ATP-binding protein n=1 Tax=Kurthia massiliensis TaxID=1033739 RepID=UPI000288C33C|nr:ABC transporter ATP-binding protein [Kurthia massiliensis]